MKKIFLMACFVMAMGIICSCSKDDEPSPDNPYAETVYSKVNLTITVTENSTVTSGATVRLYNDLTNYEKGTKNIGTLTTDSKGQATFLVESEKTYYFSVEKDGKTNALNKKSIYC
ncbi:MAG: hypothetical protein J6X18_11895 [Bacteroidales bacterium]|nr:hypothetical protein [Bacteroidales bacterium]